MRQVCGILFLDYVRMLRRRKSEHLDKYLQPGDLQYLSQQIEPDGWYPMQVFERMGLAILGEIVGTETDSIRLWGRTQISEVLRFVPDLRVEGKPQDSITAVGTYLSALFDYPAVTVVDSAEGSATVRISYGMSAEAEEAACWQALGFFESLVEEAGGEAVRGEFTQTSWTGADATELKLHWWLSEALPPPVKGLRVLVVDDEPLVLAALQRFLRRWSDVTCVSTRRQALEVLEALPIDAVLCDYDLGTEPSGLELLAEISVRWPAVGRVLHSAVPPEGTRALVAAGTIHAVAEKPVSLPELRRTIERARTEALSQVEADASSG